MKISQAKVGTRVTRMTSATCKALKESIAHWERILLGKDVNVGRQSCALCQRFSDHCQTPRSREECPVYEKTGDLFCEASPYRDFMGPWVRTGYLGHTEETIVLAWEELEFLRSLLPKKAKR